MHIAGRFQGEVDVEGDVVVGETGSLVANIKARDVVVAGSVQGDVHAGGRVELLASAHLYGDIRARQLVVAEGAVFRGACTTEAEESEPETAPAHAVTIASQSAR